MSYTVPIMLNFFPILLCLLFLISESVAAETILRARDIPKPPDHGSLNASMACHGKLYLAFSHRPPHTNTIWVWFSGRWTKQDDGLDPSDGFIIDDLSCVSDRLFARLHNVSGNVAIQDHYYELHRDVGRWVEITQPFPKGRTYLDPIQDRSSYPDQNCYMQEKFATPDGLFGTFPCPDGQDGTVLKLGEFVRKTGKWKFIFNIGRTSDIQAFQISYDSHTIYSVRHRSLLQFEPQYIITVKAIKLPTTP